MKTCVAIGAFVFAVVILTTGVGGLKCYMCAYSKIPITNQVQGEECKDPFVQIPGLTVSTTDCDGQCIKNVIKITDDFATITRDCSSTCVDVGNDGIGMHCCSGTLCNAATTLDVPKFITLLAGSLFVFGWLVARQ